MNLTSFFANKCFEYLIKCNPADENKESCAARLQTPENIPLNNKSFPPPWSVELKLFKSLCDGCGECLAECENNIIVLHKDGYPVVDFSRGTCSFCGACARKCSRGALHYIPDLHPWNLRAVVTSSCLIIKGVLCRTCGEQCGRKAISYPQTLNKKDGPEILAAKCDGCGACFASCPARAIQIVSRNNKQNPNK